MINRSKNSYRQDMQANMKKVCNLAPKTSPKPLQNGSKNLSKIDSKIISKSMPKPLHFGDLQKSSFAYIYIYMIWAQPGLTLEREARFILETMYFDMSFAFVLTWASHYLDMASRLYSHHIGIRFDIEIVCVILVYLFHSS